MIYSLPENYKAGARTYCGPVVLMLLTGKTREQIYTSINRMRLKSGNDHIRWQWKNDGWKSVKRKSTSQIGGMYENELTRMFQKLKIPAEKKQKISGMKLKTFAADNEYCDKPIVLFVSGHYLVLFKGMVYDTYAPQGKHYSEHRCANWNAKAFWKINKRK